MGDQLSLGRFIASRRAHMRITQKELADRIGVSKSAVGKWETDGGIPGRDNLRKLSDVLHVDVACLYSLADSDHFTGSVRDTNITMDLIAALESYGYKVIAPGLLKMKKKGDKGDEKSDVKE